MGRELLLHEARDLVLVEDGRGVPDARGTGRQARRDLADACHGHTLWPDERVADVAIGAAAATSGNHSGQARLRADHRAMTDVALQLHPDRLLPADPTTRAIARRLYSAVRDLPIISPHGHVPPAWIARDVPFGDPTVAADLP